MNTEGVAHSIAFPGLNALPFTNTPTTGVVFLPLEPANKRHRRAAELHAEITQQIPGLQEGFAFSLMPPPFHGLGNSTGFHQFHDDPANLGAGALQDTRASTRGS